MFLKTSRFHVKFLKSVRPQQRKTASDIVDQFLGADKSINIDASKRYLLQQQNENASQQYGTDLRTSPVMRIGGAQMLTSSSHANIQNSNAANPLYYSKTSLRDSGLCPAIIAALRQLRIFKLTELQGALIPLLIKGKHVVAHAETGTGKSFGIALAVANKIVRDSVSYRLHTIIFTPTEELALQYDRWLRHFGGCASQVSQPAIPSIPLETQLAKLHNIQPHVLVGTCSRIAEIAAASPNLFGHKLRRRVDTLILDEADLILTEEASMNGKQISGADLIDRLYRNNPDEVPAQIVAASATIDGGTAMKINHWMRNDQAVRLSTSFVEHAIPEGIDFYFVSSRENGLPSLACVLHKVLRLIFLHHDAPRILIFTSLPLEEVLNSITSNQDSILSGALLKGDFAGLLHHDAQPDSDSFHVNRHQLIGRDKSIYVKNSSNISKLSDGRLSIGVASPALSRGIHVSNISHVIILDEIENSNAFVHCAGRTGRAGSSGEVFTIFSPSSGKSMQEICRALDLPFRPIREAVIDKILPLGPQRAASLESPEWGSDTPHKSAAAAWVHTRAAALDQCLFPE